MNAAVQNPIPKFDTPFVNADGTVQIPWYKFLISLYTRSGGNAPDQLGVYLQLDTQSGNIFAFLSGTDQFLGILLTQSSVPRPVVNLQFDVSPGIYQAGQPGQLIVQGAQIELSRDQATWYIAQTTGGPVQMAFNDIARITWGTGLPLPAVFFPS